VLDRARRPNEESIDQHVRAGPARRRRPWVVVLFTAVIALFAGGRSKPVHDEVSIVERSSILAPESGIVLRAPEVMGAAVSPEREGGSHAVARARIERSGAELEVLTARIRARAGPADDDQNPRR
jgi:hypothetical protein